MITIFVPLVVYMIYEFTTINENEELVEAIYEKQLESVLYSVNQYSNDYLNTQLDMLRGSLNSSMDSLSEEMIYTIHNQGITSFGLYPQFGDNDSLSVPIYLSTSNEEITKDHHYQILDKYRSQVRQLVRYLGSGYRKLEPITMIKPTQNHYQVLMAIIQSNDENILFLGFIEPKAFIDEVLRPKMQQISNEDLNIVLKLRETNEIFYQTSGEEVISEVESNMWLFPGLILQVSPLNFTLQELVSTRLTNNMVALGLLISLLIVGFTLLIRNVNKEIQLTQAKSDFVSNVSHELRTPLALISMFAETLVYGRVKEKKKEAEYLVIIYKETNRLTNIVNRILNFSQIEANKRTYHIAEVELNQLIEELVNDYSYHLEQNGFEYKLALCEGILPIKGDRDAIYEAVVNLIDNAIKYSQEEKFITISTECAEDTVAIKISDKGKGIPADKLSQIFEKFYRVTKDDVYTAQGAGLGLTIISHIMEAHGGSIDVESKEGNGSTFTLRFKKENGQNPNS